MNNKIKIIAGGLLIGLCLVAYLAYQPIAVTPAAEPLTEGQQQVLNEINQTTMENEQLPKISPIEHASFVMQWGSEVIYFDPVGDISLYAYVPAPTMVVLTDIHGDHFDVELLSQLVNSDVTFIGPEVVVPNLPDSIRGQMKVMKNDETAVFNAITFTAMPMYNLPGESARYHKKGQGNGYVMEQAGVRVYNAGDTAGTLEMRALRDIDIAFVPMNLPYTMDISEAADAVLDFAPKTVYPFHYRGIEGLSDVEAFKNEVQSQNPDIEVILLPWYPENRNA